MSKEVPKEINKHNFGKLILSRKIGESIVLYCGDIVVGIIGIMESTHNRCKLIIECPHEIEVAREEIFFERQIKSRTQTQ